MAQLLFLDLASKLTGWCAGDGHAIPDCGAWKFPDVGADYGLLLETLEGYLDVAFQRFAPDAVGFEAPILIARGKGNRRYGDKLSTLRLLYPMSAFVEWYCRKAKVPCAEVLVSQIKKEVTGNSYAAKDDIVAVARKCGLILPTGPGAMDAADAWGGWLLLLRHYDKATSAEWDKRIWTPKGALL